MMDELSIRISGEAGQGMQTIGLALCKIIKRLGLYIFAHQDNMSRIRGGNNSFQLRISNKPVFAPRNKADILICLDVKSESIHKPDLAQGGMVVNSATFTDLSKKLALAAIYENSIACGLISALIGIPFGNVTSVLDELFGAKSGEVAEFNRKAAKAGFKSVNETRFKVDPSNKKNSYIMTGNDAIALGAVRAGCKFFSAYPMSPSTGIMVSLAGYAKQFGIVVEQAEDEIAAINMIIGASFAGARSMLGTSGGGFELMQEGVGLAGMTETPVVMVDCQRPAPATGFPTRTEQADLNFIIYSGHGEFAKAVYAPGTIEQAYYLTVKAFNIAEKYQIPVMILFDQHMSESYSEVPGFSAERSKVFRSIISKEDSSKIGEYKRYQLTPSGISPRAIPSWINDVIYADSDEHTEEGHITEDGEIRKKMVDKRLYKKMEGLKKEIEPPEAIEIEGPEIVVVGFGSNYHVMKEAISRTKKKTGMVHIPQVWPFPTKELEPILSKAKKVITVENNATGQLAGLIRRETKIDPAGSILKYDGRPFSVDELVERIEGWK